MSDSEIYTKMSMTTYTYVNGRINYADRRNFDTLLLGSGRNQIYKLKQNENYNFSNYKLVNRDDAKNGKIPNNKFQYMFSVNISEDDNQEVRYNFKNNISIQNSTCLQYEDVLDLPFLKLSKKYYIDNYELQMKEGNIFKAGSCYFRVVKVHTRQQKLKAKMVKSNVFTQVNDTKICRYCLNNDQVQQMIIACNCRGSTQFVHIDCLRRWLKQKIKIDKYQNFININVQQYFCQICKKEYKSYYKIEGRDEYLLNFSEIEEPYMIVQMITPIKTQKKVIVIKGNQRGIKFNVIQRVEQQINNYYLTHLHSSIKMKQGKFYIQDEGSQFCTFVLVSEQMQFRKNSEIEWKNKVFKFILNNNYWNNYDYCGNYQH